MFDVIEKEKSEDDWIKLVIWPEGYEFKNLGKNMTFKNITFKDLKMTTWHEMKFIDCNFINTTFTSYEFKNTFKNCSFFKSQIEIVLFLGFTSNLYRDYSKIMNCSFYESTITSKSMRTPGYIELVGSDHFYVTNSLDLTDSSFFNTNLNLYRNNITITNSNFNSSNITGSSNILNMTNTKFNSPKMYLHLSKIYIYDSNLSDSKLHFAAGYFSNGCYVVMENSILSNSNIKTTVNYGSRRGSLIMNNSAVYNTTINLTNENILINKSEFNQSEIELFFSNIKIKDSTFINYRNIENTIKTRKYYDEYSSKQIEVQVKTNYTAENSYFKNSSGIYEITSKDINLDTTHKIIINQSDIYYFNDKLIIRLEDFKGNPVSNVELFIKVDDDYPVTSIKTDANGTASYTLEKIGNLKLYIYYSTIGMQYRHVEYGSYLNLKVLSCVSDIEVKKVKFTTNTYSKINSYLEITAISNYTNELDGLKFAYKVYTHGKSKTYYSKTNSKGITIFKIPKTLTAGKHKLEISLLNTNLKKTINLKIAKAKTSVKAPKLVNKFKKSKYFKVSVKSSKKPLKYVEIKIKVYTGIKHKTYTVKTNKKGTVKIKTKKLKMGKHKVVISSKNSNYKISAKSIITIK